MYFIKTQGLPSHDATFLPDVDSAGFSISSNGMKLCDLDISIGTDDNQCNSGCRSYVPNTPQGTWVGPKSRNKVQVHLRPGVILASIEYACLTTPRHREAV